MANMTIENVGAFMKEGGFERILDHGRSVEGPISPKDQNLIPGQGAGNATPFSETLNNAIEQVNDQQIQADRAIKEMVAGRNKNIHETMLLLEKADMSFKLLSQVRNKIIDAYREVMRMGV